MSFGRGRKEVGGGDEEAKQEYQRTKRGLVVGQAETVKAEAC